MLPIFIIKYEIPRRHFFKYLQIRSFIQVRLSEILTEPPLSNLEKVVSSQCFSKGRISALYDLLVCGSTESSGDKLLSWKEDIQEDISPEEWSDICTKAQTQTVNTRLKLLQYKWLMRTYITPVKLKSFSSNNSDMCYKCNQYKGSLFHCLWECPKIQAFWNTF